MEIALLIVALMERQLLVGAMSVPGSADLHGQGPSPTPHRTRAATDQPQKVAGERMEQQPTGFQEQDAVPQPRVTKRRRRSQAAVAAPASCSVR